MPKPLRLLITVLLLMVVPLATFVLLPASVTYRITERYEIVSDQPNVKVRATIMLPRSGPYQTVENIVVDWSGEEIRDAHASVNVVKLEGSTGEDGNATAVLTYSVALLQGRPSWTAPVQEADLLPADDIESDAPILTSQAEKLGNGASEEAVHSIYAFTARHLAWPSGSRTGKDASALTAYETGIGVCADFANLMTALCRASGIPARSINGLLFSNTHLPYTTRTATWLHPAGAHAWVEVHTGRGWMIADPSKASRLPFDGFSFGRSFGQHLSYGDSAQHARVYAEMMTWAETGGDLIGAMSAPLRFTASSTAQEAAITPVVSIRKQADIRWFAAAGLYLIILVGASLIEGRLKPKRTSSGQG